MDDETDETNNEPAAWDELAARITFEGDTAR